MVEVIIVDSNGLTLRRSTDHIARASGWNLEGIKRVKIRDMERQRGLPIIGSGCN